MSYSDSILFFLKEGKVVTLRKVESSVVLGRVDEAVLASAKHAIACHLDPQVYSLSTLRLLEQRVLDSSVVTPCFNSG